MAATYTPDLIKDAELNVSAVGGFNGSTYRVQTGTVTGIPLDGTASDHLVLEKAMAVLPPPHSLYTAGSSLALSNYTLRAISSDAAMVWLKFTSPVIDGISAFMIRDSGVTLDSTSPFIRDGNGKKLVIQQNWMELVFDELAGSPVVTGFNSTPTRNVKLRVPLPARSVSIIKVGYGIKKAAPDNGQDYTGYVNSDNWWLKRPGFWRLAKYETNVNRYAGTFQLEATAVTKGTEDWSEWEIMINKRDGHPVQVDPKLIDQIDTTYPYKAGPIYPPADSVTGNGLPNGTGVVRYGPGRMTSFFAIFGIDYADVYGGNTFP